MWGRSQWSASVASRRARKERMKARLAELVSEGMSVAAAGREIGICQQRSSQLFAEIRREMGAQAI